MNRPQRYLCLLLLVSLFGLAVAPPLPLWSQASPNPLALPQKRVPQWEISAGGAARFDSALVRLHDEGTESSAQPNSPGGSDHLLLMSETPRLEGGRFEWSDTLVNYIYFAYKLKSYDYFSVAPKLARLTAQRYDIQARAAGSPTADQLRLMMQALLADRFNLKVRYEVRQEPVLALVLDRTQTLILTIQEHSNDVPCSAASGKLIEAPRSLFPPSCGAFQEWSKEGRWYAGGRNLTAPEIADFIGDSINRQVVDRTGLAGKYDFFVSWAPAASAPGSAPSQPDFSVPGFQEALTTQLGMKLEPQRAPVGVLTIEKVEAPGPN